MLEMLPEPADDDGHGDDDECEHEHDDYSTRGEAGYYHHYHRH